MAHMLSNDGSFSFKLNHNFVQFRHSLIASGSLCFQAQDIRSPYWTAGRSETSDKAKGRGKAKKKTKKTQVKLNCFNKFMASTRVVSGGHEIVTLKC